MEKIRFTYLCYDSVEFYMTEKDAEACYHQGKCDGDVENIVKKEYIKEQLAEISDEKLLEGINEFGCKYESTDRQKMENHFVWLAAGNIVEEMWNKELDEDEKKFVHRAFVQNFPWMDLSDIERLYNCMKDDIFQDIEETADEDFNDSDIRIAIRRVLFNRLGIEE